MFWNKRHYVALRGNITNKNIVQWFYPSIFVNFGSKLNISMIQRIQSVYLLLAVIVSGCVIFFLPLFVFTDSNYMILDDAIFTGTTVLSTLISFYSIFRFKNRRQQLVSGRINIIINFIFFGSLLYMYFGGLTKEGASLGLGSFMPLVAVVLITLANRGIMKDEMLVRAADRLR